MTAVLNSLVSFNSGDGDFPIGSLIEDANGDLYGTTAEGGAYGAGTVFEIAASASGYASTPTTLVSFNLSDGKIVAVASNNAKKFLDTDIRALKDSTGKVYGPELYAGGQKPEGQVTEVSYMFPRPGADTTPAPKVSVVTRAGDLACGVGSYK